MTVLQCLPATYEYAEKERVPGKGGTIPGTVGLPGAAGRFAKLMYPDPGIK